MLSVGLFFCMKAGDTYFTKIFYLSATEGNTQVLWFSAEGLPVE